MSLPLRITRHAIARRTIESVNIESVRIQSPNIQSANWILRRIPHHTGLSEADITTITMNRRESQLN
jgi:hypothetical protein